MDLVTIRSRTRDWALQFTSAGVNKSVGTRTSPIDFSCRLSADIRHIRHPFSGGIMSEPFTERTVAAACGGLSLLQTKFASQSKLETHLQIAEDCKSLAAVAEPGSPAYRCLADPDLSDGVSRAGYS